jgi:ribose transport system substrate-binding protein
VLRNRLTVCSALAFVTIVLVALCSGCRREAGSQRTQGEGEGGAQAIKIAVIPKGTTHEFWKSIHAGAVKASRELAVEIVWKGPLKEDDLKSQIDLVQSFAAQGVTGIVLAPLNETALGPSVKSAVRAGIPVVIIDSDLKSQDHVSFVATDNRAAGRLAGEHMIKLLGNKGNVVVLRYQEGSASTHHREEGFLEALRKEANIILKSDNRYGGATTESAFSASENVLLAQGAEKGEVNGVFTPNESTTFGMLLALDNAKHAGKVKFIGFDASEKLVAALSDGKIHGLVLQDPFTMGYLGVKTLVSHLRGQKVEKRIDTGSKLITRDNMNEPDMQRLLKPDLKQWLGK